MQHQIQSGGQPENACCSPVCREKRLLCMVIKATQRRKRHLKRDGCSGYHPTWWRWAVPMGPEELCSLLLGGPPSLPHCVKAYGTNWPHPGEMTWGLSAWHELHPNKTHSHRRVPPDPPSMSPSHGLHLHQAVVSCWPAVCLGGPVSVLKSLTIRLHHQKQS